MLVLSDADVAALIDLSDLLPVIEDAFRAQGRGDVERPERPHFPVGTGLADDEPLGTGLVMPAYVHGAERYVTKLADVHEGNPPERPTVHAQVAVTDARTGEPVAYMDGVRVTSARTGCIGGLAARELAVDNPVTLGVLGAGTQARWQTRAIDAATEVAEARIYSPSDSKETCAADLRDCGIDARGVDSPRTAVRDASVVVTATTAGEPVFPADALTEGALVIAVGAYTAETRELAPAVFDRAARVFADVPEEVVTIGDLAGTGLGTADLIPLSEVFEGRAGRETADEVLVVESVGTAVLDAAAGDYLYQCARERERGTEFDL